ncbi:MAG: PilZ domain-containing protein [Spirochaetaceae bacterium]|jgi:hypothetical protein|nr:PilZ domain-containing protein [Spirochaetaceae bacterium]
MLGPLFLLQTLQEFNISSNDTLPHKIAFIAGVIILAAIMIYLNVSKKVRNSKAFSTGKVGAFDKLSVEDEAYKKIAKTYRLNKVEVVLLKEILSGSRAEPEDVLKNENMLDSLFKTTYQRLAKEVISSPDALRDMQMLFSVRKAIAYFQDNSERAASAKPRIPRASPRAEISAPCVVNLVKLEAVKEKNKLVKKLKVAGEGISGTLIDISSGGCAIKSSTNIKAGLQIRIEFAIGNTKIAALGQILRINNDARGIVFHIQFIKIQPRTRCTINAYVFGYLNGT